MSTLQSPEILSTVASAPCGFERVLELLASHHGIDSRNYKHGTLRRRATRRMEQLGFSEWPAYVAHLERHPDELVALYRDVLVRVTRFFRDPAQWEHLEREIAPRLVHDHHDERRPIRIWSAGCATGEEAFGLVMVFLEQIERAGSSAQLQVFATDVSQDAVALARKGTYPTSIAQEVSPARLARFFTDRSDGYQIKREVRERVTVGYHDLLTDAPFSSLDLVACRNLLIYLEPHAQQECLRRFHFSLVPRGVLWLGNAEGIDGQSDLFHASAPEHHMYQRLESYRRGELPWSLRALADKPHLATSKPEPAPTSPSQLVDAIERFVLSHRTPACVVIDRAGHMVRLFGPTSRYLVHPQGDARPELLAWVDLGLYAELRPAFERALERSETVVVEARVQRNDQSIPITVTIEPISAVAHGLWLVTFQDVPAPAPSASPEPLASSEDSLVQQLGRELRATKDELCRVLDQMAGAEADRQVVHEELLSLNDELQVGNDALAESKALALSVNEELQTINRELEARNARLHALNADLENLLAVTTIPTIFLDRRLCVRRFAATAPGVMTLIEEDLGRPLELIAPRVAGERLVEGARHVLEHLVPVEASVVGGDGRRYLRRMMPYRFEGRVDGVCITFIDVSPRAHAMDPSELAPRPAAPWAHPKEHPRRVDDEP